MPVNHGIRKLKNPNPGVYALALEAKVRESLNCMFVLRVKPDSASIQIIGLKGT